MEKIIKIIPPKGYEFDEEKSTLKEIVFKKIENNLPMSWEELKRVKGYYVSSDSDMLYCNYYPTREATRNLFPTKKEAEAMLAMAQLCQLRDAWNNGWEPNWGNADELKYCIFPYNCKLEKCILRLSNKPMVFKTEELRNKFMQTFKDLLEKAKSFL